MDITEDKRKNEVELTAIKRAMRNTRWWKVFITVFMIAGIVAPVISIHAISTLQDMGSMLSAKYKEISVDKPGKQAALASVNKWLDTNKGPFRYGTTNLLWDSATKVGSSDEDTGTGKEHTDWWSHQFSLTDLSDGSTRDVTQLISWKNNVATAVGEPTVLPLKASGAGGAQSYTPSGYSRIDQASSFQNVVNAWAKAYIGKDSNAFTVLVGDPNSEHAYQPAAIGTFKNVSINWLVECDKNGQSVPKEQSSDTPPYAAASISITFEPYAAMQDSSDKGSDTSSSDNTGGSTVKTNITVLVKNPTSGNAKIIDWGADGSVRTLSPYANALSKSDVTSASSDDETGAPIPPGPHRRTSSLMIPLPTVPRHHRATARRTTPQTAHRRTVRHPTAKTTKETIMANDKKPELPPFAEFVNSNADLFGAIIVILFGIAVVWTIISGLF